MIGTLTKQEEQVLILYKQQLFNRYPQSIKKVILFGSSARGTASEASDMDVLVVTSEDNWRFHDEVKRIGYLLDESIDSKLSIIVLPESRYRYLQNNNFQFARNIQHDGIEV